MNDRTNRETEHEMSTAGPTDEEWEALQGELITSDREACAGFAAMLPVWPPALRVRRGQPFT